MTYFNGKFERERKERDTPERIVAIARQKGEFRVSLRWRDDWLRERCARLRREGLLVGGKRRGRELIYRPAPETPTPAAGQESPVGCAAVQSASPTQRYEPIEDARSLLSEAKALTSSGGASPSSPDGRSPHGS